MQNRFIRFFNNLPIGMKLILIYTLGVFVPLFTVNSYFITNILDFTRKQETAFIRSGVEALSQSLENEFASFLSVSRLIYADDAIYSSLSRNITSIEEYYPLHNEYLNPTLQKYLSVYGGISKIVIYSDNPTFATSEGFLFLSEQNRESLWFNRLSEYPNKPVIMAHNELDRRQNYEGRNYLSLFRNMDNKVLQTGRRLIIHRIDVDASVLLNVMEQADFYGYVELVDPWGIVVARREKEGGPSPQYAFDGSFSSQEGLEGWILRGRVSPGGKKVESVFRLRDFLFVSAGILALAFLFIFALSLTFSRRLQILASHLRRVENQDFSPIEAIPEGTDEIGLLVKDFNIMARRIDYLINQVFHSRLEQEKLLVSRQKTQLDALQSQIDPHFLNNVLESIRMKSLIKGEDETADIVKKLGRMFRRITYWEEDLVTIREELIFVREYLEIQAYRFGDNLEYRVEWDPAVEEYRMPKVSVQGLVENACRHGIEPKAGPGRVDVTAGVRGDRVFICVKDDGVGMDHDAWHSRPSGSHSGLVNIRQRLSLHYKDRADMRLESVIGEGTEITLCLPREVKEDV